MNDVDEATDADAEADVFRVSRHAVTCVTFRAADGIGVNVHARTGEIVRTQWATQGEALSDVVERWCE